ncbi:MAG: hypothetical protein ACAI44_30395 [Candidatus Sericytochromatia bacterium]
MQETHQEIHPFCQPGFVTMICEKSLYQSLEADLHRECERVLTMRQQALVQCTWMDIVLLNQNLTLVDRCMQDFERRLTYLEHRGIKTSPLWKLMGDYAALAWSFRQIVDALGLAIPSVS